MNFNLRALFVLYLIFSTSFYKSQSQSFVIEGSVMDIEGAVKDVHIQNITSKTFAISNDLGHFSILAKEKDTIYFSVISHQTKKIIIDLKKNKFFQAYLEKNIHELDSVTVYSKNLDYILQNIIIENNSSINETLSLSGKPVRTVLHLDKMVTGLNINLEAVYYRLSGERKRNGLKKEWESEDYTIKVIMNKFSESFFLKAFGIFKNDIYEYLLFTIENTPIKEAVAASANSLIFSYLEESSKKYKKQKSKVPND